MLGVVWTVYIIYESVNNFALVLVMTTNVVSDQRVTSHWPHAQEVAASLTSNNSCKYLHNRNSHFVVVHRWLREPYVQCCTLQKSYLASMLRASCVFLPLPLSTTTNLTTWQLRMDNVDSWCRNRNRKYSIQAQTKTSLIHFFYLCT